VEDVNGLVRQYFPKGSDFSTITPNRLKDVEQEINERPRKTLKFKSPFELKPKLAA
jgi:IS30 family transposase